MCLDLSPDDPTVASDTRRPSTARHLRAALLGAIAVAVIGPLGCSKSRPTAGELQEVEVPPSPDAAIDPEADVKARHTTDEELAGTLPGDFPEQLPLPVPSSLVDFGGEGEGRFVELFTAFPADAVAAAYLGQLQDGGWSVTEPDEAGIRRLERDGITATVSFEAQGSSTRVRIAY